MPTRLLAPAFALTLLVGCSAEDRFARRFARVEPGMTRTEVEALLGSPYETSRPYEPEPPDPFTFGPDLPPEVERALRRLEGQGMVVQSQWGHCSRDEPGYPQREYLVVFDPAPPSPVLVAWENVYECGSVY